MRCFMYQQSTTLVFLIPKLRRIPGSMQAIFQTIPLFAVPFVTANYFSYHYMCFGSPHVYTGYLNASTPVLILAPVALFTYLTLRAKQGEQDADDQLPARPVSKAK